VKRRLLIAVAAVGAVAAALAAGVAFRARPMAEMAAGYAAKVMCSERFVAGRAPADVEARELAGLHPALSRVRFRVDEEGRAVTAGLLGVATRTAYFRPGLGCTLAERRSVLPVNGIEKPAPRPHAWPMARRTDAAARDDVDYDRLDAALEAAFSGQDDAGPTGVRAVVVIQNRDLVAERYADDFSADRPHTGWSMSKTVTGALVGVMVGRGSMAVDEPLPVPEWREGDPRADIPLADFLHMASGLRFVESYEDPFSDVSTMLWRSDDMGAYAAGRRLAAAPGERFSYSSGTTNLLMRAIGEAGEMTPEALARFPHEALFAPIGMASAVFETDASGTPVGSSFVYATGRDWARFGQLLLQDGVWDGERVLPEGWVDYMTTPTDAAGRGGSGYGAHVWLNAGAETPEGALWPDLPKDLFFASGHDGQYVVVVPSRDTVIVRLGLSREFAARADLGRLVRDVLEALPEPAESPLIPRLP